MKTRNIHIIITGAILLFCAPLHAEDGHGRDHFKDHGMRAIEEGGKMHRGKSMMQAHVGSSGGTVKHIGEHQLKLLADLERGVLELHVMADETELKKLNGKLINATLKPKGKYSSSIDIVFSLIEADSTEKVFRANVDKLAQNLPSELTLNFPIGGTEHRAVFLVRPRADAGKHMGKGMSK